VILLLLQAKVKINQLEDQKRQMDDAIVLFDKALTNNDAYAVPDTYLEPISTDFRDPEIVKFAEVNGTPSPSEKKVQFSFCKMCSSDLVLSIIHTLFAAIQGCVCFNPFPIKSILKKTIIKTISLCQNLLT
jgi:hypothetical protein